jgi:surface polysaccharide O-acyltransferase-like enzyme
MLRVAFGEAMSLHPDTLAAHGNTLAIVFEDPVPASEDMPGGVATTRMSLTYLELANHVRKRVSRLGPPHRLLALHARNDLDSLLWYLAALANQNPVLLLADGQQLDYTEILTTYTPALVARGKTLTETSNMPNQPLHPELAVLLSTSGSTGSPKLVRLSLGNLTANASAIGDVLHIRATDRAITTLPMAYSYGLSVINSHLLAGATIVLTNLSVVDPCFWKLLASEQVTSFAGVPYTYELLDRVGFAEKKLPHLRYITQAGGRLGADRVRSYSEVGKRQGWDFHVMYGQTEATARMTHLPPDLASKYPDAVGYAIPGGSIRVDKATSEVVYSGPNVMMGYATRASDLTLGATLSELATGDLGQQDSDGLLRIVGRLGRFVKICGNRIDLDRVEAAVDPILPEASDCTAVSTSHGLAVFLSGLNEDTGFCQQECARLLRTRFGIPATALAIHAIPIMPRGPNQKISRSHLTTLAEQHHQGLSPDRTLEEPLLEFFRRVLGRPDATAQDSFIDLGGDSLSYVAVASRLHSRLPGLGKDWPRHSIADLEAKISTQPRFMRQRWWQPCETGIVLRALAILAIVGSHIGTYDIRGGAHLLIALAGFSFARFIMVSQNDRIHRARSLLTTIGRIAIPSFLWMLLLVLVSAEYGPSVLFVNSLLGSQESTPEWRYWFVEAIVVTFILTWLLTRSRWFDRIERNQPLLVPLGLAGFTWTLAMATRAPLDQPAALYAPTAITWLFALGWAAARCQKPSQRVLVSVAFLLAAAAFFGSTQRVVVVGIGFLALLWVSTVPVARILAPGLGLLAGASLYIYLTHYQVYPLLGDTLWLALVTATVVGVVIHLGAQRASQLPWTAIGRIFRRPARTHYSGIHLAQSQYQAVRGPWTQTQQIMYYALQPHPRIALPPAPADKTQDSVSGMVQP